MSTTLSDKKLAANRANAQKSTGPRTPSGKLISAQNALTHALSARLDPTYLPAEDREFYQAALDAFLLQYDPQNPLATFLVHRLALLATRLTRCAMAEAEIPQVLVSRKLDQDLDIYYEDLEDQEKQHAALLRTKGQAYADQHAPPPEEPTLDDTEHPDFQLARLCVTRHDTKNPYTRLQRYESTTHRQFQQTLTRLNALTPNPTDPQPAQSPTPAEDPTPIPQPEPTSVTTAAPESDPAPKPSLTPNLHPDPAPTPTPYNLQNEPTDHAPTQDSSVRTQDYSLPSAPSPCLRELRGLPSGHDPLQDTSQNQPATFPTP